MWTVFLRFYYFECRQIMHSIKWPESGRVGREENAQRQFVHKYQLLPDWMLVVRFVIVAFPVPQVEY